MTMTTYHETMTDAARRGQEAFTDAWQIWFDSVQWFIPVSEARLRGTIELVDKMFDVYHYALVTQREYTKKWLTVTTSAAAKAASAG